jgi:hypothetical protein
VERQTTAEPLPSQTTERANRLPSPSSVSPPQPVVTPTVTGATSQQIALSSNVEAVQESVEAVQSKMQHAAKALVRKGPFSLLSQKLIEAHVPKIKTRYYI